MKKRIILLLSILIVTGCEGNSDDYLRKVESTESSSTMSYNYESENSDDASSLVESSTNSSTNLSCDENNQMTADELFEAFCNGEILAHSLPNEKGETYTIDANWYDFSWSGDATQNVKILEPEDVDNDGELEYIIYNQVYGCMFFDCKDGEVVMFAEGEGTAAFCTYTSYQNNYLDYA